MNFFLFAHWLLAGCISLNRPTPWSLSPPPTARSSSPSTVWCWYVSALVKSLLFAKIFGRIQQYRSISHVVQCDTNILILCVGERKQVLHCLGGTNEVHLLLRLINSMAAASRITTRQSTIALVRREALIVDNSVNNWWRHGRDELQIGLHVSRWRRRYIFDLLGSHVWLMEVL